MGGREGNFAGVLTADGCRLPLWQNNPHPHAREQVYRVRDKEVRVEVSKRSLSGTRVPKVALPSFQDDGEILRWLCKYACHTLRW